MSPSSNWIRTLPSHGGNEVSSTSGDTNLHARGQRVTDINSRAPFQSDQPVAGFVSRSSVEPAWSNQRFY